MTPLLDVVFILLFAMILNVNFNEKSEAEASLAIEESRQLTEVALTEQLKINESLKSDLSALEKEIKEAQSQALERNKVIEGYSKSLSDILNRQIDLYKDEYPIQWLIDQDEQKILVEEWLKYRQIGEKYLFVEVRINGSDGRITLDEDYLGTNITIDTVLDQNLKKEGIADIRRSMLDWLDHKEGGYSFVFVTVAAEAETERAVTETVFEAIHGLQTNFDRDSYLINRLIRYY